MSQNPGTHKKIFQNSKLVMLPQGIIDRRGDNHSDGELRQIIEEQQADYDNFDKNSLLASSEREGRTKKGGSSLGGWDVNEFDLISPGVKKRARKNVKKDGVTNNLGKQMDINKAMLGNMYQ